VARVRPALWILGAALLMGSGVRLGALAAHLWPPLAPLPYLAGALAGGLLLDGTAAWAAALGGRRVCPALVWANPFAWVLGAALAAGLPGLFQPDALGLGPAIGGFAVGLALAFLVWLGVACLLLPRPGLAAAFGALSGAALAGLGDLLPGLDVPGLVLGAALGYLGRPNRRRSSPEPGPPGA